MQQCADHHPCWSGSGAVSIKLSYELCSDWKVLVNLVNELTQCGHDCSTDLCDQGLESLAPVLCSLFFCKVRFTARQ